MNGAQGILIGSRPMLFLWILLAAVLTLVVLPYLIGMLLADEYEGRLRVALAAEPSEVWRVLLDCERHPLSPMARGVTRLEEPGSWVEDLGKTQLRVTTEATEELTRIVWIAQDQVVPMSARWEVQLCAGEEAGETELRIHNLTTIRSGTWHSPVFRVVMRATGAADKVLREYARGVAGDLGVTARLLEPSVQS